MNRQAPRAPAVSKAVAVLRCLAHSSSREPVRLAQLAEATDTAKSSLLSICNALVDGGLVRRVDGGYALGSGVVELSGAYLAGINEIDEFCAACRTLAPDYSDTIHLASFSSAMEIAYLARVEGRTMPVVSPIGRPLPANCSATGKALLSKLPEADLQQRLELAAPMTALTPRSLSQPEELLRELKIVREQGYGVDDEETTPGLLCVGMPLTMRTRSPWAVGITMIKTADVAERIREAVRVLTLITAEMAERLGG